MDQKKFRILVIPSDTKGGVGKFRSISPHTYLAEHYKDEFDVVISPQMPHDNLETFFKQFDLVHIHKSLDKDCKLIDFIKFLGIPVVVDIDDHYDLGNDHPMS